MPSELKPCPFCQGEVKWHTSEVAGEGGNVYHTHNLQCPVRVESLFRDDDERIIAAWNTRAPDPQLAALQWTPITPENLPTPGTMVIQADGSILIFRRFDYEDRTYDNWIRYGYTHFRAINLTATRPQLNAEAHYRQCPTALSLRPRQPLGKVRLVCRVHNDNLPIPRAAPLDERGDQCDLIYAVGRCGCLRSPQAILCDKRSHLADHVDGLL